MDFDCVYVLAQQADPSSAKNAGKEIAEAGFRLFWNNINRLLMDYPFFHYLLIPCPFFDHPLYYYVAMIIYMKRWSNLRIS
jgi:hypothetical protein